jgi:hypothetical protein
MDEIEIKAQAQRLIEDELDRLRLQAVESLREIVGPPPKISPETAAPLLEVSYSTVYRWLGCPFSKLYLPQVDQVPRLAAFIGRVNTLREAWVDVLTGWRADGSEDLKRIFYHPGLVAVIESELPIEVKLQRLIRKTVSALAKEEEK